MSVLRHKDVLVDESAFARLAGMPVGELRRMELPPPITTAGGRVWSLRFAQRAIAAGLRPRSPTN